MPMLFRSLAIIPFLLCLTTLHGDETRKNLRDSAQDLRIEQLQSEQDTLERRVETIDLENDQLERQTLELERQTQCWRTQQQRIQESREQRKIMQAKWERDHERE